jgi:hypothetical protein
MRKLPNAGLPSTPGTTIGCEAVFAAIAEAAAVEAEEEVAMASEAPVAVVVGVAVNEADASAVWFVASV